MFKTGDKIMIRGYEAWREGEIKSESHGIYGDVYVTYFPDKETSLTSCSQKNFYQTLEQRIASNLITPSIMCEVIKSITKNNGNIEFEFKNGSAIKIIQDNSNTYRSSVWGFTSNFTCIDEFDPDDINKFFKNTTNKGNFNMPKITNYKYTEDTAITTIEWSDGTKTTVHAEHPETADPYTGFVAACAKKAFGNNSTINNLFDEWVIKRPAREAEAKAKAEAVKLEEKRIADKNRTKKENWEIHKRATEIAKEYKARKLAYEKYGVPMNEKNTKNEGK